MPISLQEYVRLTPRIIEELGTSAQEGVNAAAYVVTRQARIAVQRAVGADSLLSGMPRAKPIKPYFIKAKSNVNPQAICKASGPWQLIENPRKGGYKIKPKKKRALNTPEGPRAGAEGGAITSPLAPIRKTYDRADKIIQEVADETIHKYFQRNGWGD